MGKSKKAPVLTDYNKGAKQISHQKFRKKVKQKIREERFDEIPEDEREVTNPYDITDHRDVWTKDLEDFYRHDLEWNEDKIAANKRKFTNK